MPSMKTADRGVVLLPYRVRDWDYLGWRYSMLSSIAVGGWNNVLNMIPARDSAERASFSSSDRAWLRHWLDWTVANREYLRHTRTILGQPALGKIDGTSAIIGNRGFVFLFNPDARRLTTHFTLDESVGLRAPADSCCASCIRWKAHVSGSLRGYVARGDVVTLEIDGGSARVLEIHRPATAATAPVLFNAPGRVALENGVLTVRDVRGEVGTTATLLVAVPAGCPCRSSEVNGVDVEPTRRRQSRGAPRRFDGSEFRRLRGGDSWRLGFHRRDGPWGVHDSEARLQAARSAPAVLADPVDS